MSRSYRADEKVFQKLRTAGKTSWDEQADPEANFEKFVMRPFLEESLAAISPPLSITQGTRQSDPSPNTQPHPTPGAQRYSAPPRISDPAPVSSFEFRASDLI